MGEDCCNHDHDEIDEIVYNNDVLINTLISLLIEKKVISEKEFRDALDEVSEEEAESEE